MHPVLFVVHCRTQRNSLGMASAIKVETGNIMFTSLLWPVDGSSHSFALLQRVIDLASLSRAKVVILSVAEPRLFRGSDARAQRDGAVVEAEHVQVAKRDIEKLHQAVERAGLVCDVVVTISPLPSAVIVKTAVQLDCDLIVMATRGHFGVIDTLFSPSCTQEVIASSKVPVLVFS